MKISITIFLFLSFSNLGLTQVIKEEIEKHSLAVAYLYSEHTQTILDGGDELEIWMKNIKTGEFKPKLTKNTGTGFFIDDNGYSTYLVTAAHVALGTNLRTKLVLAGVDGKPQILNLIDLTFEKDTLAWSYHDTSDVAVLLISRDFLSIKNNDSRTLSLDYLRVDYVPDRSRELTAVGFPLDLGFAQYFSPITKGAKPASSFVEIASLYGNRKERVFLLDDSSIPGFSGSPLFEFPSLVQFDKGQLVMLNNTDIVGIVKGYVSDKTSINSGGLAAIVPAEIVLRAINDAPKFTGVLEYKYSNGQTWSKVEVQEGKPVNVLYNLNNNGKEQDKGTLKNGNGSIINYLANGKVSKINHYRNGILIEEE